MMPSDSIGAIPGTTAIVPLALLLQRCFSRSTSPERPAAFRKGLAERGYVDGSGVRIEIRFADGQYDRLLLRV